MTFKYLVIDKFEGYTVWGSDDYQECVDWLNSSFYRQTNYKIK